MPTPATVVISVRGEGQREVAPDAVMLRCAMSVTENGKPRALRTIGEQLDAVLADLAGLGGVAREPGSRVDLSWLTRNVRTERQSRYDRDLNEQIETGRVIATVDLSIYVRDFTLLERLGSALVRHENLNVENASWHVDDDNPTWPLIRSDAIHAAIGRARDYAAALNGSVVGVEHIADVGLLGQAGQAPTRATRSLGFAEATQDWSADTPSLDPVPQQLSAAVETRFVATIAGLD